MPPSVMLASGRRRSVSTRSARLALLSSGAGAGLTIDLAADYGSGAYTSPPRSNALSIMIERDAMRLPTLAQFMSRLPAGPLLDIAHDHYPYPFAPAGLIAGASLIDATKGGAST